MNISNSSSSIYAHLELANASSHNLANANTDGFSRVQTNINENSTGGVKTTSSIQPNNSLHSNTDLTKEITNQIISGYAVGANGVAIQTQDQISGTLLDIKA